MKLSGIEGAVAFAGRRWPGFAFAITGDEAHGPCPVCGCAEEDGFIIFSDGGYWCRPGGCKGWLDEEDVQLTAEEARLRKIETEQRRQAHKQREMERRLSALEVMARCEDHLAYNKTLDDADRAYWHGEGILPENVDAFLLGVCYNCPTDRERRPSYTIPVYRRDGETLWNIVHRLVGPDGDPVRTDKYRPHRAGLGKQLTRSRILDGAKEAVLVEGAKKALVCSQHGFPAMGLQGCSGSFPAEWVGWIGGLRRLWVAFDPDANEHGLRLGEGLAKVLPRCEVRVCAFPVKPDDLFARHGKSALDFEAVLDVGRLVKAGRR